MGSQNKPATNGLAANDEQESAYAQLTDYLDRNDYSYTGDEDQSLVLMKLMGTHNSFQLHFHLATNGPVKRILMYSVYPIKAPPERRATVAEFILRINYQLATAVFEMDMKDGELRVKYVLNTDAERISHPLMGAMIYNNIEVADRYMPPLFAVAFGYASPDTALEMMEAHGQSVLQ